MTPKTRDRWLTYLSVLVLLGILLLAQEYADEYQVRILNMVAIYITLAVSYNLINGVTGQFSLEPNAFVALGAYTASLLTLTPLEKEMSFIIEPCIWPLSVINIPFLPAVIIGGLVAAFFGFLMGFPVFGCEVIIWPLLLSVLVRSSEWWPITCRV